MSRILPGDENNLLHTYSYNLIVPPEKTDLGTLLREYNGYEWKN